MVFFTGSRPQYEKQTGRRETPSEPPIADNKQTLKRIAENFSDIILAYDIAKDTYSFVSDSIVDIFPDLAIKDDVERGEFLYEQFTLSSKFRFDQILKACTKGRVETTHELELQNSNSPAIYLEIRQSHNLCNPACAVFLIKNITAQKYLQHQQETLKTVVAEHRARIEFAEKISHVGSWHLTIPTGALTWSKETCAIYEVDQHTPLSFANFVSCVHPDDGELVFKAWLHALYGVPFELDHRIITSSGVKWVHQRAEFFFDADGKPKTAHGAVQDISQRKATEQQLNEAKLEAEKSAVAQSHFLANMSHEIRTPMGAIIGMAELVLKTSLDELQRSRIDKLHCSAKNLLVILNDILDFSKIEAGELHFDKHPFSVSDVVQNVVNTVGLRAEEKQLSLTVKLSDQLPHTLMGDAMRLEQVLVNLATNAVKFSNDGGEVSIGCELVKQSNTKVTLQFHVKDNGIGITDEQQRQLFTPFKQADSSTTRKYGGTGLGLSICNQLVKRMNGEVSLQSQYGEGSIFGFTAEFESVKSAATESVELAGECAEQSNWDSLQGLRVLVVEDNDINQELVEDILCDYGVVVTLTGDGQQALDVLAENSFDLVLMDCQMPVMDGYEACRRIRAIEEYQNLPVIAMTASVLQSDIAKVLSVGMNDHIGKPFDINNMLATLIKWSHKR